jgi:hypothetical protein
MTVQDQLPSRALEVIEMLCAIARCAAILMCIAGGDLAGWLGDLAPRGDLTSTQLLYRTCCFSSALSDFQVRPDNAVQAAMQAARCAHDTLIPLIALAFEAPPVAANSSATSASAPAEAAKAAAGSGPARTAAKAAPAPSKAAAAAAKAVKAWEDVKNAIYGSPSHLVSMFDSCKAQHLVLRLILTVVDARLNHPNDVLRRVLEPAAPCELLERAHSAWHQLSFYDVAHSSIQSQLNAEPLAKLLQKQRQVCAASKEGYYSASEEARHIKRLQAYVQAAADRAAEQLQEHPALIQKLREAVQI